MSKMSQQTTQTGLAPEIAVILRNWDELTKSGSAGTPAAISLAQLAQQKHTQSAALADALRYWMPIHEPLYAQNDEVSIKHRRNWHKDQALLESLQ